MPSPTASAGGGTPFEEHSARASVTSHGSSSEAELLTLLVGSVIDYAIFVLDPEGRIATWNPGAERIKGYRAQEIIGQHFSRFYDAEEVAAGKPAHELEVAAAEGRFEDEGWRVRSDGSRFWANVVITPLRDATGVLCGFAKVTRDLTERRRSEERARRLAAAEAANRTKDEFMAMLSHELRNPLAAIVSALELLEIDAPETGSYERQVISRQVRHVTRLIEDLLDISRVAEGKVSLRRERLPLDVLVRRAVELTEPLLQQRQHRLELEVAPHLEVDGDVDRLAQVLANLLTNAAKYTPPHGQIAVRATSDESYVVIAVSDNGEGITAELLPRVFDLFTQSNQTLDGSRGGLGLGLTIVRSLVGLHGGTVTAASEGRGRGSIFTVRLPRAP